MKIAIDTHTHSVASGHAYSTIDDLAKGARRRGLKGFVLTDHGPGLPGGTHLYHFGNLRVLPDRIRGVRFFRGAETNIMDMDGRVDMDINYLARLDFVMAGFHEICFAPRSREENTQAMIAALANPGVDAISHPGNPSFPIDAPAVVRAARDYGKAIEINDSSFRIRRGSDENCRGIAELCVAQGTLMVCGSDAHYWEDVGRFDSALKLLASIKAPTRLVANASEKSFHAFVDGRRKAREAAAADKAAADKVAGAAEAAAKPAGAAAGGA